MSLKKLTRAFCGGVLIANLGMQVAPAQERRRSSNVPTATKWVLDAAGDTQRNSIKSVFLLVCPKSRRKGTAFLLKSGIMVSNAHVVAGCKKEELWAASSLGTRVTFTTLITDEYRDLALLRPSENLEAGLELGEDDTPPLGTQVTTWGFPLTYHGPAPLLSVGYVAGYRAVKVEGREVKHIVVNGAFNPGNSGGPVFVSNDNKVVGIVVWKQRLFSENVPAIIGGFANPTGVRTGGSFSIRQADGTLRPVSDQEAIAAVLEEFYETVQVVIGEAISVSELKALLKNKEGELKKPVE